MQPLHRATAPAAVLFVVAALILGGCAHSAATGVNGAATGASATAAKAGGVSGAAIRRRARENVDVAAFPLRDPAVTQALADVRRLEAEGRYADARQRLERGLEAVPDSPELLQRLAELNLDTGDYARASYLALRAHHKGPELGVLCSRAWRTVAAARAALGREAAAEEARRRLGDCRAPERREY